MVYLDYSATTPVMDEVLDSFLKTTKQYIGNVNSLHRLGVESKQLQSAATKQIADLLHVKPNEIIYTSGATESNNTAIKAIAYTYQNRGKHIITTQMEHSSVEQTMTFLSQNGFEIEYVKLDELGQVDLNHLKQIIREDTILVSIHAVCSEIGVRQPIEKIGSMLKNYPKCFFHVDMTQSIGKIDISLDDIDLASFSAHKFYGLKGIGCLIKKESILLEPLLHGGKSTTSFRSGTPALGLIVSLAKALRLTLEKNDRSYVQTLEQEVIEFLKKFDGVVINHNTSCIPYIINFSIPTIKPETFLHALEEKNVFISTQSACAKSLVSKTVLAFTKNPNLARSSLRISLSFLTTKEELNQFYQAFETCYKECVTYGRTEKF